MFAKTFSFWRRLVHPGPAPEVAASEGTHEDRRLWVRYTANLDARVQLPPQSGSKRLDVRVRDISLGGAYLESATRLPPGQMIALELPTQGDTIRTVLACVVRCQPTGPELWKVGCVFSRELSAEDLASFGAERVESGQRDQRRWQRFECSLRARYQLVGETRPFTLAKVLNISASGIGLEVTEPLEAGSLINLDLEDADGQPVRSILACIVHTTTRTHGECAIGCNFIRQLAEEELQSLV